MSMALDHFCLTVLLVNPMENVLSTCMGVGGCGCSICSRACWIVMTSLPFMYEAQNSVSAAETMTLRKILAMIWTGPFGGHLEGLAVLD